MDSILDRAAGVLARHPAPAVPLAELARLLADDMPGVAVSPVHLLTTVERCPSRFRVVRATAGRRSLADTVRKGFVVGGEPVDRIGESRARAGEFPGGPWIIGLDGGPHARPRSALRTLRSSLAYLGLRVDEGSACAVARWMGLVHECGRLAGSPAGRPAEEAT
jgi:hypothetical protein